MEEQDHPAGQPQQPNDGQPSRRGSKLKWIAAGGAAFLVLVVAAGAAGYFLIPGIKASEPEGTARYFPDDVLAYSWATLSLGVGQGQHMLDIWERFNDIAEFQDAIDELLEEFEDDTGIDFEEDVLPWLGPDISFAVLDVRGFESVDAAAMFGVQDHGAASGFLEDWLEYMEDEEGARFEEDSSGDFDIWADEGEEQFYALSKDWLVFATTEDALDEVLDRISGEGGDSLAETPDFEEARSLMSDPRIMSFYVDLSTIMDEVADVSGFGMMPGMGMTGMGIPDWLAVSVRFVDRGLVVEAVAPSGSEFVAGFPGIGEPATLLPDDTLGFIAASFDPDLDNWRDELEGYTLADLGFPPEFEYALEELQYNLPGDGTKSELSMDSSLDEVLDYGIDIVEELTNINLEEDFFNYLAGQAIISVRDFDFDRAEDFEEYAVDAAALLSYVPENAEDLMDTLDDVTDLIESTGFVGSDSVDVGADEDAIVFEFDDMMGETAYSPGYVFHHGYLTAGTTENALESIMDVQNGDADALADVPEYRRVNEQLPGALQSLMFLDLQRIIAQLEPDDMDPEDYEILEETFSAAAIGSNIDAEYSRSVFVLTLFPE